MLQAGFAYIVAGWFPGARAGHGFTGPDRVKLLAEAYPSDASFGRTGCIVHTPAGWTDVITDKHPVNRSEQATPPAAGTSAPPGARGLGYAGPARYRIR
jgi:hypothetical protein